MLEQHKWDTRFMNLATFISSWSKDPGLKVGAVISKGKHIVSVGYNGFPQGVPDKREWLDDRATKLRMTIHAEVNAILSAKRDLAGCTLYVWPLPPCSDCAALIIQSGIDRVVSLAEYGDRWAESIELGSMMMEEAEVKVVRV